MKHFFVVPPRASFFCAFSSCCSLLNQLFFWCVCGCNIIISVYYLYIFEGIAELLTTAMSRKRQRCDEGQRRVITAIEPFSPHASADEMLAYYSSNQILHIKDYLQSSCKRSPSSSVLQAIRTLFSDAPNVFDKSFTLESTGGKHTAAAIFGKK